MKGKIALMIKPVGMQIHVQACFYRLQRVVFMLLWVCISFGTASVFAQDAKFRVNESVFIDEDNNPSTIILRKFEVKRDIIIREVTSVINREISQHVVKERTQTLFNIAETSIVKQIPQYVFDTKQRTVFLEKPQTKNPNILVFDIGTVAGNNLYANQFRCFSEKMNKFWSTTMTKSGRKSNRNVDIPMDSRQIWLFRTAQQPYFENSWPISKEAYPYDSYFTRDPEEIKDDLKAYFGEKMLRETLGTWKEIQIWVFSNNQKIRNFFKKELMRVDQAKRISKIHLLLDQEGSQCNYQAFSASSLNNDQNNTNL
jgi:hypothetical protein